MTIYFITGNKNKYEEVKAIIPQVEQLEIDLPEIQEIDAHKIIAAKLSEAFSHKQGIEFIVEDTSLYLDCLKGLPGPLIKWFLQTIGDKGIYNLASKLGNTKAEARTIIGYARSPTDIHYFEGIVKGNVVTPSAKGKFGWDRIFLPEGHKKTYGEMTLEEKNEISMRRIAVNKLKEFL